MTTFTASTAFELSLALASVRSGDSILLEEGEYGHLDLNARRNDALTADKTITIASADPDRPAVFSSLLMRDASNIVLDGLHFEMTADETTKDLAAHFKVESSKEIIVQNSAFTGDDYKGENAALVGSGAGYGLRVLHSDDVSVQDCTFTDLRVGLNVTRSQDIRLTDNEFSGMSGDAMKFSAIEGGLIEGNSVANHRSNPGDTMHRDMIQFLTYGTDTPSSDIVIRGNILNSGSGPFTQSIFFGNEEVSSGRAGHEMYFKNVLIEDNLIFNAQAHGITVGATDGLTILDNTVLRNTAAGGNDSVSTPKITVSDESQDVSITGNITDSVNGAGKGWEIANNLLVQNTDPLGDTYYGKLFIAADIPDAPIVGIVAVPGGLIETLGVGASMTRYDATPESLTALARLTHERGVMTFDAGFSADASGSLGDDVKYLWDFGDGTKAAGQVASHAYANPGSYNVTLTVIGDTERSTISFTAESADPKLLSLRFGPGGEIDDASSYDVSASLRGEAADASPGGIDLSDGSHLVLDRSASAHLYGLDAFTIDFSIQRGSLADGSGRVLQVHTSWSVDVDRGGHLVFASTDSTGKQTVLRSEGSIADTGWHTVAIDYDAEKGFVTLSIDGDPSGSAEVDGPTAVYAGYALTVGSPWGRGFDGSLGSLDISRPTQAGESSPVLAPETPMDADGIAMATILEAVSTGDFAGLADRFEKTLALGAGSNGDDVVVADASHRHAAATARGGDDFLIGGSEDNWIVDGPGDTIMFGGGGSDDFRFRNDGPSNDIVMDFMAEDRLVLGGYGAGVFEDSSGDANVFAGGSSAVLRSFDQIEALAEASDAVTMVQMAGGDGHALSIEGLNGLHVIQIFDLM